MHYELALVPVLAGYWFITHSNLLSNPYVSKTYHRVFFEPAVAGGGLLVFAWVVLWLLELWGFGSGVQQQYVDFLWQRGDAPKYADVLILTVLLALVLPYIYNLKYSKEKAGRRWASINETERGKILRESFEIPIIVEVLMDNGQCFIGSASVDHTALDYEGDVTFEPWMCGNRDNQTNQLTVNNLYYPNQSMARVVLMVEKMKSVSLFNPKVNDIKWNVP